jgi:hypothetical protein
MGLSKLGDRRSSTALPANCFQCRRRGLAGENPGSVYGFDPQGGEADPSEDAILLAEDFDTFVRNLVIKD